MKKKVEPETGEMLQCLKCCGKHLGVAKALTDEGLQGHPESYFTALGNMSLAADHVLRTHKGLAVLIRDQRLQLEEDATFCPVWDVMMNCVMRKMRREGIVPKGF